MKSKSENPAALGLDPIEIDMASNCVDIAGFNSAQHHEQIVDRPSDIADPNYTKNGNGQDRPTHVTPRAKFADQISSLMELGAGKAGYREYPVAIDLSEFHFSPRNCEILAGRAPAPITPCRAARERL